MMAGSAATAFITVMSLSTGCIEEIYASKSIETLPKDPIVQFLTIKQVPSSSTSKYRAVISDGKYYSSDVITVSQLDDLIKKGELSANKVAKLLKYHITMHKQRLVIVIVEVLILPQSSQPNKRIGDPQSYKPQTQTDSLETENVNPTPGLSSYKAEIPEKPQNTSFQSHGKRSQPAYEPTQSDIILTPINALTPYQTKWTIRARATTKSPIRTWHNTKGEGKLFNVTFVDETGEIRAIAFNEAVDSFYELLNIGQIFFVSGGSIKVANKQYTSVKNEYEITLNPESVIKPCCESISLPTQQYDFVQISKISDFPKDAIIDVIGLITSAGEVSTVNMRNSNKQLFKRDITLVDDSNATINLTLWGENAESQKYNVIYSVMALKGVKVSEYNGRSLTTVSSTSLDMDPDIEKSHSLKSWYDRYGKNTTFTSLVTNVNPRETPYKLLYQININSSGLEKGEYIQVVAMLDHLRFENLIYKGCMSDNCNKKLTEESPDVYRCEKCNKTFNTYIPRLMGSGKIVDSTSFQWVTFFNESIEKIIQTSAKDLDYAFQNDRSSFDEIVARSKFKRFIFKLRLKLDTFNDETRIRCTCIDVKDMNYVSEGMNVLNRIKEMSFNS